MTADFWTTDEHEGRAVRDLAARDALARDKQCEDCTFTQCDFAAAHFGGSAFVDCRFIDCDLSGVHWEGATLRGVVFAQCRLLGVSWNEAAPALFDPSFTDCELSYGIFDEIDRPRLVMERCKALEASFVGANLRDARFDGTDFAGARFARTDLRGADLSQASNYVIDPAENRLGKTRFSLAAGVALLKSKGIVLSDL